MEDEIVEEAPIRLNFQYSLDEFIDAYRLHYSHLRRMKTSILIAVGMLLSGVGLCIFLGYSFLKSVPIYLSVILVTVLLAEFFLTPSKNFTRDPRLKEEHLLIFSGDLITFRFGGKTVGLSWKQYSRFVENPQFFLLYYSDESFLIIPRRVLNGQNERQFANLVKTRVHPA